MFPYDSLVYLDGLSEQKKYNNRVARVSEWEAREDGRVGLQMLLGKAGLWVKPKNIKSIKSVQDFDKEPFNCLSDDEKNDAMMYLFATEGATYIHGVKGVSLNTSAAPNKVMCARCKRAPEEFEEYILAAEDERITPTEYVKREEGTYDKETGLFWSTECYIILGCPIGKARIIKADPTANKLTADDKAALLHAGQWGDRSSPQHWAG
eukprot:7325147-Prymnesium_polylepis.2